METRYVVVAISLFAVACAHGQTTKLNAANSVPAAEGQVHISTGDNGNTQLAIEVEHLAPPRNVASGAAFYIVWARESAGDTPRNIGVLRVDETRKGKLDTSTSLKRFDVLVTAESDATTDRLSGEPVMSARIDAN